MRQPSIEQVEAMLRAALDVGDASESKRLAARLDELDAAARRTATLLGAALWYAEHELRVFPLMPRSKQPWPRSHGCHDATSDVEKIRRWWDAAPTSNIGIATGHVVNVIDIDGPAANVALCRLIDEWGDDGQALRELTIGQVSTPRAGGRHLYVPAKERGNTAKLADGIDYRGLGGYVVAPPSYVEERTYEGAYTWTNPLDMSRAGSLG